MKVLAVNHTGAMGGAEGFLLDFARRSAHLPEVLLLGPGPLMDRLTTAGVRVRLLDGRAALAGITRESGPAGTDALMGLAGLVRQLAGAARKADLLFANSQKAFVLSALAGALARRPVVWYLHDILSPEHFSRRQIRLVVAIANALAERVIANSEATAAAFRDRGGDRRKLSVIHNGLDAAPFSRAVDAAALRREAGVPPGAPLVGCFGRLSPWKGQHVAIEALARLPGVHALIVGAPIFGETAYAEALVSLARARGLAKRVHFLGHRDDLPGLMQAVDLVAHTSTAPEPFGRVIVEGLLAGRPVVASRAGGALEIVRDGATGLLVPPGDAEALAGAIASLLNDPARARRLAATGRAQALARFSLDRMVAGLDHHLWWAARCGGRAPILTGA